MRTRRFDAPALGIVGGGTIGLFGVAFAAVTAVYLATAATSLPGIVAAGLGTVLGGVLVGAGYLIGRGEFAPVHSLRIAGWATLGTVLLGVVLVLLVLSGVSLPPYAAATLLSVSTFAHVVIGVRDVQRIRAEDLARQREKIAVLNRLVRHNLRHEAQRLLGVTDRLSAAASERDCADIAGDVESVADELASMNDALGRSQDLVQEAGDPVEVDLADVGRAVADDYRESSAASIETDLPESCHVAAGDELHRAVEELVENAVVHGGDAPRVSIAVAAEGSRGTITLADDGPGMPERERAVITRETDVDQLTHSQGLGLWYVRWVVDVYGGDLSIEADGGTAVTLSFPRPSTAGRFVELT